MPIQEVTSCPKWNGFGLNASVIRGGDSAGVLRKLYSGNLLMQSTWDGS